MLIEQDVNPVDETAVDLPLPDVIVTEESEAEVEKSETIVEAVVEQIVEEAQTEPVSKPKNRQKRPSNPDMDLVVSWFAACARCSYFFAGYKVIVGEETLEAIVSQRHKHWLSLPWSREMIDLVHKSYGSQIDTGCYHFEGCCSECQRHFSFQSAEETKGTPRFRIELKTRGSR